MSSVRNTLIKTATSYIEGFNTNTPEGVIASRTANCRQFICPSSVPPPWNSPPRSNEEYQAWVIPGFKMLRNVKISLVEGEEGMLIDDTSRKVLLHLKSTGDTDFGPYANEYMIVLKMTDDGTEIREIVEFIDSATTRDIAQAMTSRFPKPE